MSEFEKQFPKPTGNKYDHEYRLRRDEWLDRKEGALWMAKEIMKMADKYNTWYDFYMWLKKEIEELESGT